MEVGNKVKINGTNSIWDDKEGILEDIDNEGGTCTVFVDFKPAEGKKVRQDFSIDNVNVIDKTEQSGYNDISKVEEQMMLEDFEDIDLKNDETQLANHKREALAEYLDCDVEDIEWDGDNQFSYGNKEYIVCNEEEAYELAKESVRNIIDDLGLESFSEEFRDQILNDDKYFDYDTVRGWMHESYEGYAEDIEYESDSEFGNRLVQEMYDKGILTDEDFEEEEDGEVDYFNLKPEVDFEDKKAEFVDALCEDMDPVQWLQDIYGTGKEFAKVVGDNDLLDWDKVAEECVDTDGIAHSLSTYDGKEIALEGDLRAYRTN